MTTAIPLHSAHPATKTGCDRGAGALRAITSCHQAASV